MDIQDAEKIANLLNESYESCHRFDIEALRDICERLNKLFPSLNFLPDQYDDKERLWVEVIVWEKETGE